MHAAFKQNLIIWGQLAGSRRSINNTAEELCVGLIKETHVLSFIIGDAFRL